MAGKSFTSYSPVVRWVTGAGILSTVLIASLLFWQNAYVKTRESATHISTLIFEKSDNWIGNLSLLSRLRVVEGALNFGAYESVEGVLNQSMVFQTNIESIAIWDARGNLFASSTYNDTGLYVGPSKWISKDNMAQFNLQNVVDDRHGEVEVGHLIAGETELISFRKPILFDEQIAGYVGVIINFTELKKSLEKFNVGAGMIELNLRRPWEVVVNKLPYESLFLNQVGLPGLRLEASIRPMALARVYAPQFVLLVSVLLLISILSLGVLFLIDRRILSPINFAIKLIKSPSSRDLSHTEWQTLPPTSQIWGKRLTDILIENHELRAREREFELINARHLVALQVAHDIRSPLTALDFVLKDLSFMQEERKKLARSALARIRNISEDLLAKYKGELAKPVSTQTTIYLPKVLEDLVAEKKVEASGRNVEITLFYEFDFFCNGPQAQLARALSNIINNGIEAMGGGGGDIQIEARRASTTQIALSIKDSGCGISELDLGKILSNATAPKTEKCANTGSGYGLGLAQAKAAAKAFGGEFTITSEVGRGTSVTMMLPLAAAPTWFVNSLEIKNENELWVFDDEFSVHGLWQIRLNELGFNNIIKHFYSISDFETYIDSYLKGGGLVSKVQIFVDYEIANSHTTGLDIIEKFKFQAQTVLVSSHTNNDQIVARSVKGGMRILPKQALARVPMTLIASRDLAQSEL